MQYLIKNQKGSTIIILTFLILTAVLSVVLTASKIVQTGLVLDRTQFESTKAYFAAEAGAERILWAIRNDSYDIHSDCCATGCYVPFSELDANSSYIDEGADCDSDLADNNEKQELDNKTVYIIKHEYVDPDTIITVTGSFDIIDRRIQLKY